MERKCRPLLQRQGSFSGECVEFEIKTFSIKLFCSIRISNDTELHNPCESVKDREGKQQKRRTEAHR